MKRITRLHACLAEGLITGEEEVNPTADILCCTAECAPTAGDTLVLDEVHWLRDNDRGHAWTRLLVAARSSFRHVRICGPTEAEGLLRKVFDAEDRGDDFDPAAAAARSSAGAEVNADDDDDDGAGASAGVSAGAGGMMKRTFQVIRTARLSRLKFGGYWRHTLKDLPTMALGAAPHAGPGAGSGVGATEATAGDDTLAPPRTNRVAAIIGVCDVPRLRTLSPQ